MIAIRIYDGETAEQIGIPPAAYASRKRTLDRYLETTGGTFDPKGYLSWLAMQDEGQRKAPGQEPQHSKQVVVGIGHKKTGCGCGDKSPRKMPSKAAMAKSLLGEAVKFAKAGFNTVGPAEYQRRLAVCDACPEFTDDKRCRVCGCFMAAKAKMATTDCALGKWPKFEKHTKGAKPKTEIV